MNENDEIIELNKKTLNDAKEMILPLDWKNEVINGNFMPAIMKLIKNEIDSDSIVDLKTGNRILHFAVFFSCLNVVRVLIEKYNANINVRNNFGHTPFHILCNQNNVNLHLFSYMVKNDKTNLDPLDNSNISPICFSINSHFNLAFLYLVYNNCQIYICDVYNNNLLYWVLSSDNKFVLKFLISHMNFDINCSFFNNTKTLSDNLISSPFRSCAKYLLKYHYDKINISSLMSCLYKEKFSFYNDHNYEFLKTIYSFKVKNTLQLLIFIVSEILYSFKFKAKNMYFLLDSYLSLTPVYLKVIFCLLNISLKIILFIITKDDHPNIIINEEGKSRESVILSKINYLLSIVFYVYSVLSIISLKFLFTSKVICEKSKTLNQSPNILRLVSEQILENIFELPQTHEICIQCLIRKPKDTHHCNMCNKCVNDFFFHSRLFNRCFSKSNLFSYLVYTFSMILINSILFFTISNLIIKTSPFSTNYISHFIIILIFSNYYSFILLLYMFLEITFYSQNFLINLFAIGYGTTYRSLFTSSRYPTNLRLRNNNLAFIPESNIVTLGQFYQNIWNFFKENLFN